MRSHLCSERRVFGCSWEQSQMTFTGHSPAIACFFHNCFTRHLENICICQQTSLKPFFKLLFVLFSPLILQVSKQQDCFGGNFQILSHECSSQRSAADVFCKLYTAFIWDQRVALAVGLNLCLAVYAGWYTILDQSQLVYVVYSCCSLNLWCGSWWSTVYTYFLSL